MIDTPLKGIKVVELARILAGPWAGQILTDLGAEVSRMNAEQPASLTFGNAVAGHQRPDRRTTDR